VARDSQIHEANHVREHADGLKVGGHQASSASVVSLLTALYFRWLRPHDMVSVKPHASPAYHAVQYLLGDLDRRYLPTLRSFGGLQSYPSRTKDPDRVDFSTGSVGLGAVTPMFAALADRYVRLHFAERAGAFPERRFVALIGDAELDEGNVWEAVLEDSLAGMGNVTVLVDLNRQSLDRVVPGIRSRRLAAMFSAAGWHVIEAKYGRRLQAAFAGPGGAQLRARIDDMANEEYHSLIRAGGGEARERFIVGARRSDRDSISRNLASRASEDVAGLLADLGGHDLDEIVRTLNVADGERKRPSVVFAYTLKGWGLPFAGDPQNHSALMTPEQIATIAASLGASEADPWAAFPDHSPEGRLCGERGRFLREQVTGAPPAPLDVPDVLDVRLGKTSSTQQAFGEALVALARLPVGSRIVTTSPDVSVSTNLGGWINRVGVFSPEKEAVFKTGPSMLSWEPGPDGRHIELGITEMNLFLLLSQFGLTAELFGETLVPIGTLYDPFIARGLDALVHALYIGARFLVVATPSGITLAPEGGAHQSSITSSIGIELPGLRAYEPAFAQEVSWCLLEGLRGCADRSRGFSTYLRLSSRPNDQAAAELIRARIGETEWRRQTLAGGYRLLEARQVAPNLPSEAPSVTVVAMGAMVTEAVKAVTFLIDEEVAANLIVVTSAERLSAELHDAQLSAMRHHRSGSEAPFLASLILENERHDPMVTVADSASHTLSFLGSAFGARVIALGVDAFGQSGTVQDLYSEAGIDADHIIEAALLAIEAK
jgi:pyruvate dehydrogenase E1 component